MLVLAVLSSSASVASAGTYVSLGVGGTPSGQGALAVPASSGDSGVPQQRVALGQGLGRLAVEASLGRFAIGGGSAVAAGVHARVTVPLDGHLNLFARLGMERVWLADLAPSLGEAADGGVGGLGLEYRVDAPIIGQGALWAEVNQDQLTFDGGATGGVRMWTVGLTLGL